jgi:hypothetical protein
MFYGDTPSTISAHLPERGVQAGMCPDGSALQERCDGRATGLGRMGLMDRKGSPIDGPRTATYAALFVFLVVSAPSSIELSARETVRLDRVTSTADGITVDRYGDLLRPGTSEVHLDEGVYHLRTVYDARLWISDPHVVTVVASDVRDPKNPWPPPTATEHSWAEAVLQPLGRGAGAPDRTPLVTVHYGQG